MSDLQQISLCLRQVTVRSLVLIDEFGKGTNENGLSNLDDPQHESREIAGLTHIDGIGLACGVLEHLLNLDDPPKVIAATHFHEIFENDFLPLRPGLQLGHMEVNVCEESREVEDQVTYLYKLGSLLNPSSPKANIDITAFVLVEATRVTALCMTRLHSSCVLPSD